MSLGTLERSIARIELGWVRVPSLFLFNYTIFFLSKGIVQLKGNRGKVPIINNRLPMEPISGL